MKATLTFALPDDREDFDYLNQRSWHAVIYNKNKPKQHVYGQCTIETNGSKKNFKIHRIIINITDPKIEIDHINGDTLDNRKENLRPCTKSQNMLNSKKQIRKGLAPKSKYKGVAYSYIIKKDGRKYIRSKPWTCNVRLNRKSVFLGYFKTEQEAAYQYNVFMLANFPKEILCLNQIEELP